MNVGLRESPSFRCIFIIYAFYYNRFFSRCFVVLYLVQTLVSTAVLTFMTQWFVWNYLGQLCVYFSFQKLQTTHYVSNPTELLEYAGHWV